MNNTDKTSIDRLSPGHDTAQKCYQPKWQTDLECYQPKQILPAKVADIF